MRRFLPAIKRPRGSPAPWRDPIRKPGYNPDCLAGAARRRAGSNPVLSETSDIISHIAAPPMPTGPASCERALSSVRRIAGSLATAACVLAIAPQAALAQYRVELEAPAALRDVLKDHLDLMRYRDRKDLSDDQFNFMLDAVADQVTRLASTEGYFQPTTAVAVDLVEGQRRVRVKVSPGPRMIVANTELQLSGAINEQAVDERERLRREWPLTRGAPFRQEDWAAAKAGTLSALQRQRFPAARITSSQARAYPDLNEADLEVAIDSGPVFRLGPLQIDGARRYPESIIRNLNPLRPGEEFSADRLLELQRQIQRMPYYSNVVVDIARAPALAAAAPVQVRVTEYPTQRVRFGAGYATDTGAHLEGRYSHYDLFDRAWVFDTQTRLERRRQLLAAELTLPPAARGHIDSMRVAADRTTVEGVDLRTRRIGVRRTRETDKRDFAYTLQYYHDRLTQIDGATPPADVVILPGTHRALVAGVDLTRRQVDNPRFPREGYIANAEVGAALKGLLTDQTFVRAWGRLRQYFPIGRRDIGILRAELGGVITKGGNAAVPGSLLFRAGGNESVRGYSYQSIGNERNGIVYPTRFIATGSAEYQRWFLPDWGAAVFYDVGAASDRWSGKSFFHAVGAGARWRSPIGSINADLAYGFQQRSLRPHFSLGIVF